jgi:hypothetical protein
MQGTRGKGDVRKVGRPPLAMSEPIPDTLENVAKAIFKTPPRKRSEWEFMQARSQIWPAAADEEGSA